MHPAAAGAAQGRPSMTLQGKVALITGGDGAIGRAVAERLSAAGARVALADLKASDTVEALDVTDEDSWIAALARVQAKAGPLDILVNAAGVFVPGVPFEDLSLDLWRRHFAVNVDGAFLGCRLALAAMKGRGGAVVNISSSLAEVMVTDAAAYCASKAAVLTLTRLAAKAGAAHGVRVNAVLPGAIESPMLMGNLRPGQSEAALLAAMAANHPIGRLGQPLDVAEAIAFLCSPAAAFITGAMLAVDGGRML